jgi:phosphoribosylglycinamide formyltransferase 1
MQALVKASLADDFPAQIVSVLSNNPDAGGLEFAADHDISTKVINHREFDSREDFDAAISEHLSEQKIDLICLAGFMRLLTPDFVNKWRDRIINIHPSLLPAFKGLHVHERAIESGTRFTGCTVHYVRPEMDDGPIVAQAVVPILQSDTPDVLADRILEQEHRIYPLALKLIAERKVKVHGSVAKITGAEEQSLSLTNPRVSET